MHSLSLKFRPKEIEIKEIRDETLEVAMREREREYLIGERMSEI